MTDAPEEEFAQAPRGAYVVVMTHSHALDFLLVEAALARDDWRYLGLIGSQAKRNQFEHRLAARGDAPERMARVICPIGVAGPAPLRSKEPGVIAVAVAAEMLSRREGGGGMPAGRRPSNRPHGMRRDPDRTTPRLALAGITKIYPSVVANDGIALDVLPGEIHAVLGENGAGKSTLMKIIYGVVKPDAGTIEWEGTRGRDRQSRRARASSASAWCSSTSRCSRR